MKDPGSCVVYHVSHKFARSYGQRLCEFPRWLDLSSNLVTPHHHPV